MTPTADSSQPKPTLRRSRGRCALGLAVLAIVGAPLAVTGATSAAPADTPVAVVAAAAQPPETAAAHPVERRAGRHTTVTLKAPKRADTTKAVTFTGKATGVVRRTLVTVQYRAGKAWRTQATTRTQANGTFKVSTRLNKGPTGNVSFRALLSRNGTHAGAQSAVRTVYVAGPASLTIAITGLPTDGSVGGSAAVILTTPAGKHVTVTKTTVFKHAAPGRWHAVGSPVSTTVGGGTLDDPAATLWPGDPAQSTTISKTSRTLTFEYATLVPTATKIAAPSEIAAAATLPDGTVEIRTTTDTPTGDDTGLPLDSTQKPYTVGDVFVTGSNEYLAYGTLGRITSVSQVGQDTVLVVDPTKANLLDAVPEGSISTSRKLTSDQLVPGNRQARTIQRSSLARRDSSGDDGLFTDLGDITDNISCESSASFTLDGEFNFNLEVGFDADWDWELTSIGHLDTASAYLDVTQDAHLIATALGDASCELDETALLREPLRFSTFQVQAGPVPVWLTPQVQFYADGSIEAHAKAEYGYTEDFHAHAEVNYDQDRDGDWYDRFDSDLELDGPNLERVGPTFDGSAAAEIGVSVEATLLVDWLAGPDVTVRGALMGSANLHAGYIDGPEAEGDWSLDFGMGVQGGLNVDELGLDSPEIDIWDNYDDPWNIASGSWKWGFDAEPGLTPLTDWAEGGENYTVASLSDDGSVTVLIGPGDPPETYSSVALYDANTSTLTTLDPPGANDSDWDGAISSNGRWVAVNRGSGDLWLYDRKVDTYTHIPTGRGSEFPLGTFDITDDGSVLYEWTYGNGNGYVLRQWDRTTGQTTQVDVAGPDELSMSEASDDGTRLLLSSLTEMGDLYLFDRTAGTLTKIRPPRYNQDTILFSTAMSGDGTTVTFYANGQGGGFPGFNAYIWSDGQIRPLVDDPDDLVVGNQHTAAAPVSDDGRYVTYETVDYDESYETQIAVYDTVTGGRAVISREYGTDGVQGGDYGDATSWLPAISGDGHSVAFLSWATNIGGGEDRPDGSYSRVLQWRSED